MRLDVYSFDSNLSQSAFDELVNGLLVDVHDFSEIACLEGKGYGVTTICNSCGITINDCARRKLVEALIAAQATTEELLGFDLTPHYHVEEFFWGGERRIQLQHPGIATVNISRSYTTVGTYPISPYVIDDVPMIDSGNGFCIATLDGTVVKNPNEVWIRNVDTGERAATQQVNGYPKRVAGNWQVAMSRTPAAPACNDGETYGAQHCKYMLVDIPNNLVCSGGTILPCYPNSNQLIPLAKPVEAVGSDYRYWFHPWVLVDSAFADDDVSLVDGEFYKLLEEITFKCVKDVTTAPVLTMQGLDDLGCQVEFEVSEGDVVLTIVDAKNSVLEVYAEDVHCPLCGRWVMSCGCHQQYPFKLRVYYKTDPSVLGMYPYMGALKDGIANLVAASLPLSECNCPLDPEDYSFIAKAQKAYTDVRINPVTGTESWNLKFGNLHGQLVYAEKLSTVPKKQMLKRF